MKLTVTIHGVDGVFDVANAAEGAQLLAAVARESAALNGSETRANKAPPAAEVNAEEPAAEVSDEAIHKALLYMSGRPSAKLLVELCRNENGLTDTALRESLGVEKLGAIFSHISKCCNKASISKWSIYLRREKRLGQGRMRYHYQITEHAKAVVDSMPAGFETEAMFPGDDETDDFF